MDLTYKPAILPNRFRFVAVFFPAPGISPEEFHNYWLHEHGRLFMSLDIVKKNLTKYEQLHFNHDAVRSLTAASSSAPEANSYWGMAIFEAESFDKLTEVFSHPDYQRVVFPDEQVILDKSRTLLFAGQFATILNQSF